MLRRTSEIVLGGRCLSRVLSCVTNCPRRPLHFDSGQPAPSIIKNFFIGKFTYEMFDFPKMESTEEFEDLEMMGSSVEKFMTEEVDSRKIDAEAAVPEETLTVLKQMGLFGQQIPIEYGGLGLNATKFARLAEHTALDGAISVTLAAHQTFGLKGILLAGTEEQKRKYLPRLASGEDLAAFCLTEPNSGSDAQSIRSKAVLSEDGSHYLLSGNKIWISNGGLARIMTVFAKTEAIGADGEQQERVTAFIVERDFGGVTSGAPEDKLGVRGANTCSVTFDNTPVPVENVLGEVGQGFKLAMNILNSDRFSMGSTAVGVMKFLIKDAVNYALMRQQFGRPIGQFQLIKEKIAKMAIDVYVIESMTYLTAGLIDRYGEKALALESAAVKIFSSEALWTAASESLQIYGGFGYTKDFHQERLLRDARAGLLFGGTNEVLRMQLAGNGLKFVGLSQMRNLRRLHKPKQNFLFHMKRSMESKRCREKPCDEEIVRLVHPLLSNSMLQLSKRLNHFHYITPEIVILYGRETIEQQMLLRRTANIAIDTFAACAVISRIGKSLSQRECDDEFLLASAALQLILSRIHRNNMRLGLFELTVPDEENERIANRMYKERGYCAEHPLTRNW